MTHAGGTFSTVNFLMTTVFRDTDFRAVEALAAADSEQAGHAFRGLLQSAPDRASFVLENSFPIHEKRHLFDIFSTPYGIRRFLRRFFLTVEFHNLLNGLAPGGCLRIPLKSWRKRADCPASVKEFLKTYDAYAASDVTSLKGSKWSLPSSESVRSEVNQSLIMEVNGRMIPSAGYLIGDKLRVYELTALPILEGLAVCVQLGAMTALEAVTARSWLKEVDLHPIYWWYTSALNLASACCHGNAEETIRMLEFALMIPFEDEAGGLQPEEKDPGWRLTRMAEYLLNHKDAPSDMNAVADVVSRQKGWRTVSENLASARSWLGRVDMADPAKPQGNYFHRVIEDFRKLSHQLLDARLDSPLLGLSYVHAMGTEVRPPMHRKIRPDGTAQIFCDSETGEAWAHFLLMSSMMEDAVSGRRLDCPLSRSSRHGIPGDRTCDCDSRVERETCLLIQAVESLKLDVVPV